MDLWLVAKWLVVFGAVAALGAPVAAMLFPRFPKRGAAFALPAALVPLTIVIFLVGQVSFGAHTVFLAVGVVAVLSAAAYRRGHVPNWLAVAGGYFVFALGFSFLLLYRASDPNVTPAGGEHFLHYGLLKALLRTGSLPPEDFWYAGKPIRYYYGTQLQYASFSLLTDTAPRYSYNLGLAVFYGLLVVTAYGVSAAVTAAAGRSRHLGGALGVFFVAVAGAGTTAIRLLTPDLPDPIYDVVAPAAFGFHAERFGGGDLAQSVAELSSISDWGWWYTRYVVEGTLQEFPFYSFVKSDLHGHAMANGYILFAAALAFAYYRTPEDERRRRLGLIFGGLGGVAGLFGFMNTWSLPTAVGLAWLAMAAADAHPATLFPDSVSDRLTFDPQPTRENVDRAVDESEPTAGDAEPTAGDAEPTAGDADGTVGPALPARLLDEGWRVLLSGLLAVLVAGVGVAIASPFMVFGDVPKNGGVGLFPPRSDLGQFLVIYGPMFALLTGFLAYRAWHPLRNESATAKAAGAAALGVTLVVAIDASFPVLALSAPLLLGAWWLVRTDRLGFEGVLLVAGVGLILSMELVHAKVWPPDLIRWNTALKVAVQGWTLAGAAAGVASALALATAADGLRKVANGTETESDRRSISDSGSIPSRSAVAAVFLASLVVTVVALSAPFAVLVVEKDVADELAEPAALSLDGLETHDRWRQGQMEAIYWLDDREGTPTIVEAPGRDAYRWSSPASTLTGIPAVIGWDHQRKHRGMGAFENRAVRVDEVYAGSWENASAVLHTYDVDYVYVGPNERDEYGDDLRSFDRPALSVAFENEAVTIYAVDRSALPETSQDDGSADDSSDNAGAAIADEGDGSDRDGSAGEGDRSDSDVDGGDA